MNILLVEDNEGDIELTERAFRRGKLPATLLIARDGMEGADFLNRRGEFSEAVRPDLILLDLNMPRLGGRQFLEDIKTDVKLQSIPILVFTSSNAPQDIRDCYDRHANGYILKPFDLEKFMELMKNVVGFWSQVVQPTEKSMPLAMQAGGGH